MNKARITLVLLLSIMLVSGLACGNGTGYQTYTDNVNGFSIDYPEDWEMPPEELWEGAYVAFYAPEECSDFTANFNVVGEGLPFSMSVQTYYESVKSILQILTGYTPISEEEMNMGVGAAIEHVYSYSLAGQTMTQMQIYLVEDQTAWVLTFSTVPACWGQYEPTFDTVVDSFQLLD